MVKVIAMAQVVLAETDQPLQHLLRIVLTLEGHTVLLAPSRQALWQQLANCPDSCVIVLGDSAFAWRDDILQETIHAITSSGARHAIILLTASPESMSPETHSLLQRHQVCVVPLPFDLDRLAATIAAAVMSLHRPLSDADRAGPSRASSGGGSDPTAQAYGPPLPAPAGVSSGPG